MRPLKKIINFLLSRLIVVAVMLLTQIVLFLTAVAYFSTQFFYVYLLCLFLSVCVILMMISRHENPAFKITWIVAILTFPVVGGLFYLILANRRFPRKLEVKLREAHLGVHQWLPKGGVTLSDPHDALQSGYIQSISGYPLCEDTSVEYFSLGDDMFRKMLAELGRAEHYIFLEFFIIRPGIMWDSIFEVLCRKVKEGVAVYMLYDDIGSISTLPKRYNKIIRAAGIRLHVFNPFRPHVSTILNYRDHRKLMVIDGKTAFCGGLNLADEYINRYERFGHWKDTGVMLRGEAVRSFVVMFLQQWQFTSLETMRVEEFVHTCEAASSDGKIQVFGDSPLDSYNITETVYFNAIVQAKRYIYITTPYLIIDYAMIQALCNAALSGVDVRIYTPHCYDKWYVHLITRSNYAQLIRCGVKVYEYTPGFLHGKMFDSDDSACMVGTCNMDYRSFYMHFECSVLMYDSSAVQKVKQDMLECQAVSQEITLAETQRVSLGKRILRSMLRLFSPLM